MDIVAQLTCDGLVSGWGLALIAVGVFVAGFVDAIAGGGGLISLPAYLFAGVPVHAAIYTNKLGATMGTVVATIKYLREGFIQWRVVLPAVVVALIGSTIGANLTILSSENVLRIFMLCVIPVAGFYVIKKKEINSDREPWSESKTRAIALGIGFVMGLYDGFYGPGTGTFMMLLFTGIGRMSAQHAAGATKVLNLTTNATAMVVYLANGGVWVLLGLCAGLFSIAGNYLGARFFANKGAAVVKPIILVVLVIFAVHLICELFGIL